MSRIKKFLVYGLALWLLKFAVVHIIVNADTTTVLVQTLQEKMWKQMRWKLGDTHTDQEWVAMTPRDFVKEASKLVNLKIDVKNQDKIPKSGKLVVIANHDNRNAGVFIAALIDQARDGDVTKVISTSQFLPAHIKLINEHREYRTMVPGAEEKIKSYMDANNPLVIFPKVADYYTAHQDKSDTRFRFMDGFLRIAIDNESDILPVKVHLDYPWWWRILWFVVPHTLGRAILDTYMYQIYSNTTLHITIGDVIPYSKIKQDKGSAIIKRGKTRYPERVVQKYQDAIVRL